MSATNSQFQEIGSAVEVVVGNDDRQAKRLAAWNEWVEASKKESFAAWECTDYGDVTSEGGIPNVIEICPDGSVLIEKCELRRVVVMRSDGAYHVLRELLTESEASTYVAHYNAINPDAPAESIDYPEAYRRAFALEISEGRRDREWAIDDKKASAAAAG